MASELKRCPFCGGKAQHIADGGDHWVECKDCKTTSKFYHPEAEAIDAWNRRASPTFTRDELEFIIAFCNEYEVGECPSILRKCEAALKGGE